MDCNFITPIPQGDVDWDSTLLPSLLEDMSSPGPLPIMEMGLQLVVHDVHVHRQTVVYISRSTIVFFVSVVSLSIVLRFLSFHGNQFTVFISVNNSLFLGLFCSIH